jgi:excisionase family DNA binding protein
MQAMPTTVTANAAPKRTKRSLTRDELCRVLPAHARRTLLNAYKDELAQPGYDEITAVVENGRTFSPHERARLRVSALAESFSVRRQLLADTLTSSEVARILGTTRQTPLDRLHQGTLLALRDGGTWHFPAWQFDAAGPDGLVPGLAETLAALETSPFIQARWLQLPHPELDQQTPLEALRRGQAARVIPLAAQVEAF